MTFVVIESSNKDKCEVPVQLLVLKVVVVIMFYFNVSTRGSFTNYSFKGRSSA